jgi:hypothetical protein
MLLVHVQNYSFVAKPTKGIRKVFLDMCEKNKPYGFSRGLFCHLQEGTAFFYMFAEISPYRHRAKT